MALAWTIITEQTVLICPKNRLQFKSWQNSDNFKGEQEITFFWSSFNPNEYSVCKMEQLKL